MKTSSEFERRLVAEKRGWLIGFLVAAILVVLNELTMTNNQPLLNFGFGGSIVIVQVSGAIMLGFWLLTAAYPQFNRLLGVIAAVLALDIVLQLWSLAARPLILGMQQGQLQIPSEFVNLVLDGALLLVCLLARQRRHNAQFTKAS